MSTQADRFRIRRVRAHRVEYGLDFTYATGTLSRARAIVWEIETDSAVGIGECNSGGIARVLEAAKLSTLDADRALRGACDAWILPLIGADVRGLEALFPPMPSPLESLDRDLLVVREGLSIALYDLLGRVVGVPVHALLGGARRTRLPGMPVVHVGPAEVMARRARKWVDAGFGFLKIKFRGSLDDDVAALRSIRERVGPRVRLAIDANSGYARLDEALAAIDALKAHDIDYFEDMLSAPLDQIAELRRRCAARVMVDAQAWWPNVHHVISLGAADVINHHPNNQGGLATALSINAVANAAGIETAIGSSGLFGIQNAAFQHLAAVIALSRPCEDIGILPYHLGPTRGEYAFDAEPSVLHEPLPIDQGEIVLSSAPGLGVELEPRRLHALSVGGVRW